MRLLLAAFLLAVAAAAVSGRGGVPRGRGASGGQRTIAHNQRRPSAPYHEPFAELSDEDTEDDEDAPITTEELHSVDPTTEAYRAPFAEEDDEDTAAPITTEHPTTAAPETAPTTATTTTEAPTTAIPYGYYWTGGDVTLAPTDSPTESFATSTDPITTTEAPATPYRYPWTTTTATPPAPSTTESAPTTGPTPDPRVTERWSDDVTVMQTSDTDDTTTEFYTTATPDKPWIVSTTEDPVVYEEKVRRRLQHMNVPEAAIEEALGFINTNENWAEWSKKWTQKTEKDIHNAFSTLHNLFGVAMSLADDGELNTERKEQLRAIVDTISWHEGILNMRVNMGGNLFEDAARYH